MIWPTLHQVHTILGHPSTRGMHATLQARHHHPHLWMYIECFACDKCQCAPPAITTGYPPNGTLPVLLQQKLQLIALVHGPCQHHIVMLSSLLLNALTPQLCLLSSQGFLKNLATTLLLAKFTVFVFQRLLQLLNIKLVPITNTTV